MYFDLDSGKFTVGMMTGGCQLLIHWALSFEISVEEWKSGCGELGFSRIQNLFFSLGDRERVCVCYAY